MSDSDIRVVIDDTAGAIIQAILEDLGKAGRACHIPPPPPADAPLQKHVDRWFEHELATDRQKFCAITLSMFNGLRYPDFMDIYEMMLQMIGMGREKGKPDSHFGTYDDDLITQVRAEIVRSDDGLEEILRFEDERYPIAVFNLMRRRHRGVLLHLLPILKHVVERYHTWEIRSKAALAVAEIGRIGFRRTCSQVLEPWAGDPRAYVRAAVGYPLARLAEEETSRSVIEGLLDDWTDEHWNGSEETWRYRWTAASTYKQIGSIEADWAIDWACRGLKQVAGFDDIRLADSVIHSLVVLSLQGQLERVLLTVKEWIEEGSAGSKDELAPQTRCIVGTLAFMFLSEIHIELATEGEEEAEEAGVEVGNLFELVRQSEADKGEYWELMIAVGVQAFEHRLADAFFGLIKRWTKYAADVPALQNTVRNLLAEVSVQVRPLQCRHILNRLTRWEKCSTDKHLIEMAASAKDKVLSKHDFKRVPDLDFKSRLATATGNIFHRPGILVSDDGVTTEFSLRKRGQKHSIGDESESVKSILEAERKASLERQLFSHYRNRDHLEEQLVGYGSIDAPLRLLNQLDDEKAEIQRLEKLLGKYQEG